MRGLEVGRGPVDRVRVVRPSPSISGAHAYNNQYLYMVRGYLLRRAFCTLVIIPGNEKI